MARIIVEVMLKPEILDPQGQAVKGALGRLGLTGVTDVRQGKRFVIDMVDDPDPALIDELAATLLSNPVIEDYRVVSTGGCRCGAECGCQCGDGGECTCNCGEKGTCDCECCRGGKA